jgi:EmrB/QacA subfamily drug resistance transporter
VTAQHLAQEGGLVLRSGPGRIALAATVAASAMASLDATVVNVALPHIGHDLHAGVGALQWVLTGYLLSLSSLILVGGALGDRIGRRRVFAIGTAWFAGASVLCGLAPNVATLIAARVLQGVGGALLTPGSLAILEASFREADRAPAIGAWSGLGGAAGAIGPFVGGALVDGPGWRWAFLVNVPVAAIAIVAARAAVPETRDPDATGRFDTTGVALATAGLAAGTWSLTEAGSRGWTSTPVAVSGFVAVIALAAFVSHLLRARDPLVPPRLFANRTFTVVNLMTVALYAAIGVTFFLVAYELEVVGGWSATKAGVAMLPATAMMLVGSAYSGALAQRIGPRLQLTAGPLLTAAGLVLLARIGTNPTWSADVLPGAVVFGLGLVTFVAPLTATVMGAADPAQVSVASGVNNALARTASLAALAAIPAVSGLARATGSAAVTHAVHESLVIAAVLAAVAAPIALVGLTAHVRPRPSPRRLHCAVDGPPLQPDPHRCPLPARAAS